VSGEQAFEAFYGALLEDDAESLYERAPCGYLSTTPDGTIVKVNQTFLTLTAYERADLVGQRTFAELLSPGGRIYHETHYAPMLQMQGMARAIALEIVCADGHRLPVLVNSVLDRDASGAPAVIRTAVFDATERREYERELLRAKRRAEESELRARALAQTLQQTLIPPAVPEVPGLDLAGAYRPAGDGAEVGGDFYDIFEIGPGDWVVAIGDICGKGVEAAVITALARYTLRAAAVRSALPSQALDTLNEVLLRQGTDRFCTAALLRLRDDGGSWIATVGVGGHPLPVLARVGEVPGTVGRPGSLLGLLPDPELHDTELVLQPGDGIVLYTDGVTEGRSGRDFYGDRRLGAVIAANHRMSATDLVDAIVGDVLEYQSNDPRDDVAVVAVRVPVNPRGSLGVVPDSPEDLET
jgi:sigma-B regulation protein RsbU (phosphoserine phosphatase)